MKRKPRKKRKPLGKPLPPATDADIAITPEDIERAKIWVRKFANPRLQAMQQAEPEDTEDFE